MKKTILLIAALFVAAMASAQITKVATLDGTISIDRNDGVCGNVLFGKETMENETKLVFYDDNFNNYKTLTINKTDPSYHVYIAQISRNYFTTDGKVCFIYNEYYFLDKYMIVRSDLINEDGQIVYSFGKEHGEGGVVYKIGEHYYLLYPNNTNKKTDIYQLPGNGEPSTDLAAAPAYTSRAIRKSIRKGLITIDTPKQTYSISGQMIEPIH